LVFDDSLNPSYFETKKTEDRPLVSAYRDEILKSRMIKLKEHENFLKSRINARYGSNQHKALYTSPNATSLS
jgi:hypothetical protein